MNDARKQAHRRTDSRRRARASVLWTLLAFVVLQLGLGALLQSGVITPRDSTAFTYRALRLRERLERRDERPFLAVMFGSSRVRNGWQAGVVEKSLVPWVDRKPLVYNFGVVGGGHIYSYYSLERLMAEGIRPDLVLIEMFPPFLAQQAITELQWFGDREWSAQVSDEGLRSDVQDFSQPWWETWLIPWYTYRFYLLNVIAPELLPAHLRGNDLKHADDFGWVANWAPPQTQQSVEHVRTQFASHFAGFRLGGPSVQSLRRAIDLCERNGIRVALVLLPEASEMRGWYSADMENQVERFMNHLRNETSVTIADAREWINDEEFSDANHLRASGAAAFTERFAREVLPGLFNGNRQRPDGIGSVPN